jgi:toxin ParE1/3/4
MGVRKERLVWSVKAEDDLLSIWRYGADQWSPIRADKHLRKIKSAGDRLLGKPKFGKSRDELLPGIRSTFVKPHVVFYRVSATAIEIVRLLRASWSISGQPKALH